jgi:hypothetical protein
VHQNDKSGFTETQEINLTYRVQSSNSLVHQNDAPGTEESDQVPQCVALGPGFVSIGLNGCHFILLLYYIYITYPLSPIIIRRILLFSVKSYLYFLISII